MIECARLAYEESHDLRFCMTEELDPGLMPFDRQQVFRDREDEVLAGGRSWPTRGEQGHMDLQAVGRTDVTPRPRRWRRWLTVAIVAVVLLAAGGVVAGGWKATDDIFVHAPRTTSAESPATRGLTFDQIAFGSPDGTSLVGWWIPAQQCGSPCTSRGTVVAASGYTGNKSGVLFVADSLARGGFNVLAVDMRGQGESGGHTTLAAREPEDMLAAIDVARSKSGAREKIGLYGHSMAAATALIAAERANQGQPDSSRRVAAVVEDSGFASMGEMLRQEIPRKSGLPEQPTVAVAFWMTNMRLEFDPDSVRPVDSAAKLGCPLLVIHGQEDALVSVDDAKRINEAAQAPKDLWIVPGAGHESGAGAAPNEFTSRIREFYGRYLR